ncbi:unnamed protein product [Chrysoparadoxa australica]
MEISLEGLPPLNDVLLFLNHYELAGIALVSRRLKESSENAALWDAVRERLWNGKFYIAPRIKELPPKQAVKESLVDATRTVITAEELTSLEWCFRFKEYAGEMWSGCDPWWLEREATRVKYTKDGNIEMKRSPDGTPAFVEVFGLSLRWRFQDHTTTTQGSKLLVSTQDRLVPSYILSRHPEHWGWLLQSCWILMVSWPLPLKTQDQDPYLLDENLAVRVEDQWDEVGREYASSFTLTSYLPPYQH